MFNKTATISEKKNQSQQSATENRPLLQKHAAPFSAERILQMQKTIGNRAVTQLLKQTRQPLRGQGPIQMSKGKLTEALNGVHESARLTSLDVNTLEEEEKGTLNDLITAAKLQAVSGFFHKNDSGLLPDCPWIMLEGSTASVSPYIEFNLSYKEYSRVVYDAMSKTLYLTPHYDGFIRLDNVSVGAVNHLDSIAATNVGYLLEPYNPKLNAKLPTAAGKINAWKLTLIETDKKKY